MKNDTKKITEGAMMVAIVGLLLFINRQLAGMIEYMMYWILTFPILIYTAKYGVKNAMVPSVCMLLLSLILSVPTTVFYMFSCIVTGVVYGGGIRKEWKNGSLLFWTFLFTLFSYLITFVLFASIFGFDPHEDMEIAQMLLSIFHMETNINITKIVSVISILSTLLMSILQTMCIHMIGNMLLSRLKIQVHAMKPILQLKVPKVTAFIIIIIWVLFYMQNVIKLNQELSSVLFACYLIAMILAIGYGALTWMCWFMMKRKKALVFLVVIAMFIPYLNFVIACTGVGDMIFDFKNRMSEVLYHGSIRKF